MEATIMDEHQQAISAMRAITVSREYGSGGGEIATRLAKRLAWRLIDHAIITQVARELEIHETAVQAYDEHIEGRIGRILSRMRRMSSSLPTTPASFDVAAAVGGAPSSPPSPIVQERAYQETLRHVVQAAANEGHAVIVGRGGQVILADRRDVLHVRVVAPLSLRVAYVARREGLDEAAARTRVQTKERARTRYMQTLYHCNHEDPHLYDLVVNTGVLSLDSAVELICRALEHKATRLNVPAEELGPAAGMAPYAARPADFPAPQRAP
jgi:cytidylate kinase